MSKAPPINKRNVREIRLGWAPSAIVDDDDENLALVDGDDEELIDGDALTEPD